MARRAAATSRDDIVARLAAHRDELRGMGVASLALFGSAARGDMAARSDIDVLVEFSGSATFDGYMDLKDYLRSFSDDRWIWSPETPSSPRCATGSRPKSSMSRDLGLYHGDIEESCRRIVAYTEGLSFGQFADDTKTVDAVARNLGVIGEAVKRLPTASKKRHPETDSRKVAGLRDVLIHACFRIDVEILWDIVQNKVPVLARTIAAMQRAASTNEQEP